MNGQMAAGTARCFRSCHCARPMGTPSIEPTKSADTADELIPSVKLSIRETPMLIVRAAAAVLKPIQRTGETPMRRSSKPGPRTPPRASSPANAAPATSTTTNVPWPTASASRQRSQNETRPKTTIPMTQLAAHLKTKLQSMGACFSIMLLLAAARLSVDAFKLHFGCACILQPGVSRRHGTGVPNESGNWLPQQSAAKCRSTAGSLLLGARCSKRRLWNVSCVEAQPFH